MRRPRSLTFWQPMPTPHLFALAEAMADHVPHVRFVTLDALDPGRAALGWASAESGRIVQAHANDAAEARALCDQFSGPDDVHVLPGLKPAAWIRPVQKRLRHSPARIVVMAEAALPQQGWRAAALRLRDRAIALHWRDRIEQVLAMGAMGVEYYHAIGFTEPRVREFGYFPEVSRETNAGPGKDITLVFAGALIRRKGLDLVLEALALAKRSDWHLSVAGEGPERASLQTQARSLGLADRITWLGAIPVRRMPALLAAADMVLVPSRFDGWGAVTNEALGVGTPVLASDRCGSAAVLARPEFGAVFTADSPAALAHALNGALIDARPSAERRSAIRSWAQECLSPSAGAAYLAKLLVGDREAKPSWRLVPDVR